MTKNQKSKMLAWAIEQMGGEEQLHKEFLTSKVREDPDMNLDAFVAMVEKAGLTEAMETIPLQDLFVSPTIKLTGTIPGGYPAGLTMETVACLPNLSQRETEILYILQTHRGGEGITRRELAQITQTTPTANSGAIRALEDHGYLRQWRTSECWYYLTHHGKLRLATTCPAPSQDHD